jgi:hypothetical protein
MPTLLRNRPPSRAEVGEEADAAPVGEVRFDSLVVLFDVDGHAAGPRAAAIGTRLERRSL